MAMLVPTQAIDVMSLTLMALVNFFLQKKLAPYLKSTMTGQGNELRGRRCKHLCVRISIH